MTDPSSLPAKPPAPRLDRSALERVLARAAELQSGPNETGEEFTEEQLIELGKEVGLSPQHLRQAMAEERTRSITPEAERGIAASLFGPSRVRAARTVAGRSSNVLATIDAWMQRQELMIVKRHLGDRMVWEPRRDLLGGLKRVLRVGGRDYALSNSFEVAATVVEVDDGRVHVGLEADFRRQRTRSVEQVAGGTVVGAAATTALILMGIMTAVAVAPVVILPALGVAGARALQTRVITRAHLSLEQLLDQLERGELNRGGRDSLLGAIVAAATALPPRRL